MDTHAAVEIDVERQYMQLAGQVEFERGAGGNPCVRIGRAGIDLQDSTRSDAELIGTQGYVGSQLQCKHRTFGGVDEGDRTADIDTAEHA